LEVHVAASKARLDIYISTSQVQGTYATLNYLGAFRTTVVPNTSIISKDSCRIQLQEGILGPSNNNRFVLTFSTNTRTLSREELLDATNDTTNKNKPFDTPPSPLTKWPRHSSSTIEIQKK
jgi:hypothetical protein